MKIAINNNEKSLVELAYEYVKGVSEPVEFEKIKDYCFDIVKIDKKDVFSTTKLYTALTLDGRFITFKENKWDLKNKHKYRDLNTIESYFQE